MAKLRELNSVLYSQIQNIKIVTNKLMKYFPNCKEIFMPKKENNKKKNMKKQKQIIQTASTLI